MKLAVVIAFLALSSGCAGPGSWTTVAPPERVLEIPVNNADSISIDIPVGEVSIIGMDANIVRAEMIIRCESLSSRCAKRAAKTQLTSRANAPDDKVSLSVNRESSFSYRNSEVEFNLHVPANKALQLTMGYGEVEIDNLAANLSIVMEAGDITIKMPEQAVKSVSLDAGVGDASLDTRSQPIEGDRSWLIGAEVEWNDGPGDHVIDVDLQFGDIEVELE